MLTTNVVNSLQTPLRNTLFFVEVNGFSVAAPTAWNMRHLIDRQI